MKTLLITLCAVSTVSTAFGQPALPACKAKAPSADPPAQVTARTYQEHWCDRILEIAGLRSRAAKTGPQLGVADEISNLVNVRDNNWRAFLLYVQARSSMVDASPVEDARVDKQVGAPAGAGSTSLVSKGSVPGILGFAVENGALTQTTSSTTVTLRGNLVGWLDLLKNQAFILSYQDGSGVVRALRRVSYSLTLNTDSGATAEPAPSGPAALTPQAIRAQLDRTTQQLAGYSVRMAIVDQRDPRTAANRASIATLADTQLVELLKANRAFDDFLNSAEYSEKWLQDAVDQLSDPTTPLALAQIQRILYQRLEALRLLMINRIDGFEDEVARNLLALNAYDKARRRLFETIRKRPLFAFEYVNAKTSDLPDSSTIRFIGEGQWGSRVDLTANAAMTFQHAGTVPLPEPKDIGGQRDFQLAAQMDVPLGSLDKRVSAGTGIGAPVVGVAFLLQDLTDRAAVSFAGNTFTIDKGMIVAVQGKVTVSVKGSGVKIPLSISYANRTEMLKEKDVRGHIGVTFDMDVLSSVVRR